MTDMQFGEWREIGAGGARIVDRASRRGRAVRPPIGLHDGEAYRLWLSERVTRLAQLDQTEEERQSTEQWMERISAASTEQLWAEYIELTSAP